MATGLSLPALNAQNNIYGRTPTEPDSLELAYRKSDRKMRLQDLEGEKKRIEDSEKFRLKQILEAINKQLERKEITADEAKTKKEEAAKTTALNIDQKLAIVENQIKLAERDNYWTFDYAKGSTLELGLGNVVDDRGSFLLGINFDESGRRDVKYDKRTYGDVVIAGGINNVFSADQSLSDSPYKIWKSGFSELGFTFRTRLMKESNFLRLAYGASFQIHSFELGQNRYFAQDGPQTVMVTAPEDLKVQKLRVTNLVFPVYLEFGPSRKYEFYDRVRYNTVESWKAGIGGYAGLNVWNRQNLRYYENGRKITETQERSFNVSNFVYGVGAYVGFGPISLYATYDLQPLFKDNLIKENVFSLGLRLDL